MATTDNILQTVQTYQRSLLARLINMNCFISTANTRFKNFENFEGNLGDTVTYDTPPQMISNDGLVVTTFSAVEQLKRSLTVNKSRNVNFAFNASQLVFNIDNTGYRDEFEKSAIKELGSFIEQDVASVIPANTYRFYNPGVNGSGSNWKVNAINSFTTLSDVRAVFDEYGSAPIDYKMYLPNRAIPQIIGSGLNQFALDRNNRIAMSWEVGDFQDMMTYRSNLLPLHTSGTTGNAQQTLTVVSVTRQADGGITSITFSGATASDVNAVKAFDIFQFNPTTTGTQIDFLSYNGHANINLPLQFEATADAIATSGGNVVISVSPVIYDVTAVTGNPLVAQKQNTNFDFSSANITAGITALGLPSHRCGLLTSGNPLYIAMPKLPDMDPFKTVSETDPDTGVGLRMYTGAGFGTNTYGSVLDCIWGKDLESTHSMRIPFPVQ